MARTTTIPLAPRADRSAPTGSLLFVGTATLVVRLGGFTLLTDPNFLHAGDHAHLGYGLTSRRLTDPALEPEELPPLDACVLSHLHGDHWDDVATARLSKELPILTTHQAARALRRRRFSRAHALATWDDAVLLRGEEWLRIVAVPARHGPPLVARLLPPVIGTIWEWGEGDAPARHRLYVSGDTLVHDALREIPRRFPDVDLGVFHLGGTRVLGVLVTLDADQGVEAIRIVRPRLAVPVHFDDYPVFRSPLQDFVHAAERAGISDRLRYLGRGERLDFSLRDARAAAAPAAGPTAAPRGPVRPSPRAGTEPPEHAP